VAPAFHNWLWIDWMLSSSCAFRRPRYVPHTYFASKKQVQEPIEFGKRVRSGAATAKVEQMQLVSKPLKMLFLFQSRYDLL